MFATATVVEIDDQLRGDRFKIIVAVPRAVLIPKLYQEFADYEKRTAAGDSCPFDVSLRVTADRRITITVSASRVETILAAIDSLDPADRQELCDYYADELASDRRVAIADARDERRLVAWLAENLARIMQREGMSVEALAERAGMEPERLAEILAKQCEAALLSEISNLAESLGTTTNELIERPKDQGAQGWN